MGLGSLAKKPRKLLGVDASTHSFAWALFEGKKLINYGEITFVGKTTFERLADAQRKVYAMRDQLECDEVVIEAATMVANKKTVIMMAYAFGAIISALARPGVNVREVPPITWQYAIANKPLTREEKVQIKKDNPGRKESWLKNEAREIRKRRTMDWVAKNYGVTVDSNNISDAIAIGAVSVR